MADGKKELRLRVVHAAGCKKRFEREERAGQRQCKGWEGLSEILRKRSKAARSRLRVRSSRQVHVSDPQMSRWALCCSRQSCVTFCFDIPTSKGEQYSMMDKIRPLYTFTRVTWSKIGRKILRAKSLLDTILVVCLKCVFHLRSGVNTTPKIRNSLTISKSGIWVFDKTLSPDILQRESCVRWAKL